MLTTHARACQPATGAHRQPIVPQRCCSHGLWLVGSLKRGWRAARAAYRVASGQTVNTAAQRVNRSPPSWRLTGADSGLNLDLFKGLNQMFSDSQVNLSSLWCIHCPAGFLSHTHTFDFCYISDQASVRLLWRFIFDISVKKISIQSKQPAKGRNMPVSVVPWHLSSGCEGASGFRI